MKLKDSCSLGGKIWQTYTAYLKAETSLRQKGLHSQSNAFSSSHVQVWEMDHKEGWVPKNWCFWIMVLEQTLESLLDSKEIIPVNPKRNQPWILIERTDAEAEALIIWPHDMKSRLTGKDLNAGKDQAQEEKGATEYEMAGWNHWLDRHECEQPLGDGEGQRSLGCYSPWGHKESDMT